MEDFSFLSDTDDSAVEELISQAQDLSVLEQVSAINCSGFTDSLLPTDLDTRFRKLKSFPLTKRQQPKSKPEEFFLEKNDLLKKSDDESPSKQQNHHPEDERKLKSRSGSSSFTSPSISSNLSTESVTFSGSKENSSEGKKVKKSKSRHGSFHSPLASSNSNSNSLMEDESRSPSPPSISGCFFCSPKRAASRKKRDHDMSVVGVERGKDDEILSDLNIFSTKEQRRILKKAMKEEEKINREAEKIVKWAKQASARMNISDVEDELSDDDIFK